LEERKNLWAPWRMTYIKTLSKEGQCFICQNAANPQDDQENLVLWRTAGSLVMFNKFPYNNGHMLIAPTRHIAGMEEAGDDELLELTKLIREVQAALTEAVHPNGFNVGMNFGRCAGAGLPGHLHIHVVPRWDGDTNFMAVTGGTDVISQGLHELYGQLREISSHHRFPRLA
jgi:ATP adenylyltransferase